MVTEYNTHKQAAFAHLENVPSLHASKLNAGEFQNLMTTGALIGYYTCTTHTNLFLLCDKLHVMLYFCYFNNYFAFTKI